MKQQMYAIYDTQAETFRSPFFTKAVGLAIRSFTQVSNDKDNEIGQHPSDFYLYRVGYFDDDNGGLHAEEHGAVKIMSALEAVKSTEREPDVPLSAGGTN